MRDDMQGLKIEGSGIFKEIQKTPPLHKRAYVPTLAELVDRLTICQLKSIFIPEHGEAYKEEMALIQYDIDLLLQELEAKGNKLNAEGIRAICVIQLSNRYIWENESKARQGGSDQDRLLKLTHSINGVRNTAKNVLARATGERLDHKVDCFASELVKDFGNWNIF